MADVPKVFISYSWTSPDHEDWVINLAEKLVSDGVDVIIDKWELKEGHDKLTFMESTIKSEDITKVLIILDKKYAEKAEQRTGGVGTETQIISPTVYANVSQEKFIPIVAERDEAGNAYVPTYLESRIYVDLSSRINFEENYEKLLRNIYKRPAHRKPQIGTAPSYLFEETPTTHKTSSIARAFEEQIIRNPKRINAILREFLDGFFDSLKQYTVSFQARDQIAIGKEIHDKLNLYLPLRNDFIFFFNRLTKEDLEFEIDIVNRFLERLNLLKRPLDDRDNWGQMEFDVFRFAIHELFIYLIAIGLKNENYKFVEELLYNRYFLQDKYESKKEPQPFSSFYNYVSSFDEYYKQAFSKNFVSPMAEFMIERVADSFDKENIVEADLLCHYIAALNGLYWFPLTYLYKTGSGLKMFSRMTSARHFEKVKRLFGVSNVNQLKEKLKDLEQNGSLRRDIRYSNSFEPVTPLSEMINVNDIATTR